MSLDFGAAQPKRLAAGSHRIASPEETLARVRPLMPRFGITRIANVTGLDRIGLPVALAIRPNARAIAVSQGKGRTLAAAEASALMESVEIWHAEHMTLPLNYTSAADLPAGAETVELARLPLCARSRFDPNARLLWSRAEDLMSGRAKLVPYEMVHADYTSPGPPGAGCFPSSTNGLASGNHVLEAICHGICEVVERDALSVWHAQSESAQMATALDPASVDDPWCRHALAAFDAAGLQTGLWDVTSDTGVATLMCIILDPDPAGGHLGLGSGTHPDPVVALARALSEAAQTRLNYISGAREDLDAAEYAAAGRAEKTAAAEALLAAAKPQRAFSAIARSIQPTLQEDLDWLLARLDAVGIREVATVDLTRPEFAIPVVRVVIPGLEAPHDDATYTPGPRAGGQP